MSDPQTPNAARDLVMRIADGLGYLSESDYDSMDAYTRQKVERAMSAKDTKLGRSAVLLARELYSKDVRFIFELLQNADDNLYSRVEREHKEEPTVAFQLYRHKVIVECNEDGFEEGHLRAICDIGQSSKAGGHGYIGEKGIGFKSVFKVAWKVLIQSGAFCFTFTHRPGDNGMGMITPVWEDDPEGEPDEGWTRITLYLHQDAEAAARYQDILKQLNELDSMMLLFLKKLRRIYVTVHNDSDDHVESTALFIDSNDTTHRAVLTKQRSVNGTITETNKTYCHVTKHQATGLAKSANRTYTANEESTQSYSKADVILAFPLTSDDVPIVQAQQVFAFLPIRRLGFNFLIHTDFVTAASREDVDTSATRNIALLDGIAEAFIKAIHEMYGHEKLRYQWMRYLTGIKNYPWDDFWKRLVDKITTKIHEAEILEPRRRGSPRRIRDLRRVEDMFQDSEGQPLFEDLSGPSEIYISTGYTTMDQVTLGRLGLDEMSASQFVARVQNDLGLANSRMKNPETIKDWHERAAKAINHARDLDYQSHTANVTKSLSLLPLSDGTWVSAKDRDVYLPTLSSGVVLPTSLDINILDNSACKNSERLKLFKSLGARHANVEPMREKALKMLQDPKFKCVSQYVSMLAFLYYTCPQRRQDFYQYSVVTMVNSKLTCGRPGTLEYLFPSNDAFSPWQLSLRTGSGQTAEESPILNFVGFVHEQYLTDEPSRPDGPSWREWLELAIGVRRFPRLVDKNSNSLSRLCKHMADDEPESFLPFLRHTWESENDSVLKNPDVLNELKATKVLCGMKTKRTHLPLQETYLPVHDLQQKVASLMQEEEDFPFVMLNEETLSGDNLGTWTFLKREQTDEKELLYIPAVGDDEAAWVKTSDCLMDAPRTVRHKYPILLRYKDAFPKLNLTVLAQFFQNSLGIVKYSWKDTIREIELLQDEEYSDFKVINTYYESLQKACRDWVVDSVNTKAIRQAFEDSSLIFIPNGKRSWLSPSKCLWSSKTEIQGRSSLNHYDDSLKEFFVNFLNVPCLSVNMVYDELLHVDPKHTTTDQVKDLLWQMNAFLAKGERPEGSAEKLLSQPILPVTYPAGDVRLCSCKTEFAIVDRQPLMKLFHGRAKLLAFDLNEVHRLRPFLQWARLEGWYLSKLVKKSTDVDTNSTFSLSDPSQDIAQKAQALTRVAVHLRSPRVGDVQAFYNLLRSIKTLETDTISSRLTVTQGGEPISVENQRSEVYINDKVEPLTIYVPHDEVSLCVCFGSSLPRQLVIWMMTNPTSSTTQLPESPVDESVVAVMTGILSTKSAPAIDRILDNNGIVDVKILNLGPELPVHVDTNRETSTLQGPGSPTQPSLPVASDSQEILTQITTPSSPSSGQSSTGDFFHFHSAGGIAHRPRIASISPSPPAAASATSAPYRRLLAHVVRAARATATLPQPNKASAVLDPSTLASPVAGGDDEGPMFRPSGFGWTAATSQEKKMIGAAGELFVFELLRSALHGSATDGYQGRPLTREVWKTPIRALVAEAHADYADMAGWPREEEADIVIEDDEDGEAEGAGSAATLVRLLVALGYLGAEWAGRSPAPRCYVEVKATMGDFATPFFMSDAQYRKMSDLTTQDSIYMIFRVFCMGLDLIGVRIYMDPDRMRREGGLRFTADRWTVTPGHGAFTL